MTRQPDRAAVTLALLLDGAVSDEVEALAVDFCARGETVRLEPVPAGGTPQPHVAAVVVIGAAPEVRGTAPVWRLTGTDGVLLDRSTALVAAVRRGDAVVGVQVRDAAGRVLSEGTGTSHRTVSRTVASLRRLAGPLVVAAARNRSPMVSAGEIEGTDDRPSAPPRSAVAIADALAFARFLGRLAGRFTASRRYGVARLEGPRTLDGLISAGGRHGQVLDWQFAPGDDFWADPCLVIHEGTTWIYVEELNRATGRGQVRALRATGSALDADAVCLRTDHHVSFPQIYRTARGWYATVETCDAFNPVWTFDAPGQPWRESSYPALPEHLADPVLLFDEQGLPSRVVGSDARVDSYSVAVEFALHEQRWVRDDSCTYVDVRRARSGGTLDPARGIRAVQDCGGRYGLAVELLPHPAVPETGRSALLRLEADCGPEAARWRAQGFHTLTWSQDGAQVWCDGWRDQPTPRAALLALRERQHLRKCGP